LFRDLVLVAQIGATLFDTRLNGLAHALVGRILAWSDGNLTHAGVPLSQAAEKLLEAAPHSPFLARIREESVGILRQFGGA
jgi:ferric-dicitrate binding protein FerR (iron transport regulator)